MSLTTVRYEGIPGNRQHITMDQRGTIATTLLREYHGARAERRHEHRNLHGERWEAFVEDVRAHGVREPIFVTVDPGRAPEISEGNHRLDAALAAGRPEVPVEIRYYGHAERSGTIEERARGRARTRRRFLGRTASRSPLSRGSTMSLTTHRCIRPNFDPATQLYGPFPPHGTEWRCRCGAAWRCVAEGEDRVRAWQLMFPVRAALPTT